MAPRPTALTPDLFDYLLAQQPPLDDVRRDLIAETQAMAEHAELQISPDEGAFLTWLTRLSGARRALELGTFTGFSALSIVAGLADGGTLTCCDVSEAWTSIARKYWDRAGVGDRIELRIGPALTTLREMPAEPTYDFAFIDADKPGYPAYWDEVVPRMRTGGVICVDNVLYHGDVIDPERRDTDNTRAVRELNDKIRTDGRVDAIMVTIADGITLARVR